MRSTRLFASLLLVGCAGKAPGISGDVDAGVDSPTTAVDAPGATTDAPPVDLGEKVSGKAIDYYTALPVATAMVTTDGVTPALNATSGTDGAYAISGVAAGSKLFLSAIRMNYKLTRNLVTSVAAVPVLQDIFLLGGQDIKRQYTTVGVTQPANSSTIIVDLRDMLGATLLGIAPTDIVLLDINNAPVTTSGVFFIGSAGDTAPATGTGAVAVSTAYTFPAGGATPRARAAVLGVVAGTYTLQVTYTAAGALTPTVMTQKVTTTVDSALLAQTGGMTTTTTTTDPTFATDIYPKLQKAGNGGLGCANCHTAGGQGAVLQYDLPAAMVYTNIMAATGVVNLTTPATSLLLVRPLYEQPPTPQDHPNATFLDTTDPNYQLFLLWITKGAKP